MITLRNNEHDSYMTICPETGDMQIVNVSTHNFSSQDLNRNCYERFLDSGKTEIAEGYGEVVVGEWVQIYHDDPLIYGIDPNE